jgi:hypothetical protein
MSELIPDDTLRAAKRGFIRTSAQSLATSFVLPAGTAFAFTQDALLAAAVGVGGMLVGAAVNGLQSFFSIIGSGIPDDYQPPA